MIKLISISKAFDKNEIHNFKQYARLYFGTESKAHIIINWILSILNTENVLALSLDEIYDLSDKSIKKQTFKNLISELGNISEEYIAWLQWRSHKEMKNTSKLIALAERSLNDYYLKIKKLFDHKLEKQPIDIFSEYYKTIALFYDYNFQISNTKDNYNVLFKELIKTFKTGIAKVSQSLLVEIKNRERLVENENWQDEMDFFDLLYDNPTDIIHITDQLILLNNEGKNDSYLELLNILKKQPSKPLSHFLRYSILIYCTVYLHGIFKKGDHMRVNELFSLYEYGLENKIITPNDLIDTRTYLNIISVFSKLGSTEKTREIIAKYTRKVDYFDIKTIEQIAISTLDFNKGKYEKVLLELRSIEPYGFHLKFKTRWLLLKSLIVVQNQYPAIILGQISNFNRYINTNKNQINKPTFLGLKTTIQVIIMIINKKSVPLILKTIDKSKFVFEKKWILNMVNKN